MTELSHDTARAFLYGFLAHGLSYPTEELLGTLRSALDDLEVAVETLALDGVAELAEAVDGGEARVPELCAAHNALFATELLAPAAETAYELDKAARRAAELADIQGFYRAFGLELATPLEPDSLVAELEFLSLLLQKKAHAAAARQTDGEDICAKAYHDFLADHLGRWYRVFGERLRSGTEEPFYRAQTGLLTAFLDREVEGLTERPHRLRQYFKDAAEGTTWACRSCPAAGAVIDR